MRVTVIERDGGMCSMSPPCFGKDGLVNTFVIDRNGKNGLRNNST